MQRAAPLPTPTPLVGLQQQIRTLLPALVTLVVTRAVLSTCVGAARLVYAPLGRRLSSGRRHGRVRDALRRLVGRASVVRDCGIVGLLLLCASSAALTQSDARSTTTSTTASWRTLNFGCERTDNARMHGYASAVALLTLVATPSPSIAVIILLAVSDSSPTSLSLAAFAAASVTPSLPIGDTMRRVAHALPAMHVLGHLGRCASFGEDEVQSSHPTASLNAPVLFATFTAVRAPIVAARWMCWTLGRASRRARKRPSD